MEVLWDAVKRTTTDVFELVRWWKQKTEPILAENPQTTLSPFQKDAIARVESAEWDISVLAYAIRNCDHLLSEGHKPLRECAKELREIRNSIFHKKRSEISFVEYGSILQSSIQHYETLLSAGKEEYVKKLARINKCEDKRIEVMHGV